MADIGLDADQVHDEIAQLRGQVDRLNEVLGTATGNPIQVTDPLVATDPVNGGPETWHAMTLQNGWANNAPAARYRLVTSPPNSVEVIGDVAAGTLNAQFAAALPSAYWPVTSQTVEVVTVGNTTSATRTPIFTYTTAGVLTFFGLVATVTSVRFHGFVSLDVT